MENFVMKTGLSLYYIFKKFVRKNEKYFLWIIVFL